MAKWRVLRHTVFSAVRYNLMTNPTNQMRSADQSVSHNPFLGSTSHISCRMPLMPIHSPQKALANQEHSSAVLQRVLNAVLTPRSPPSRARARTTRTRSHQGALQSGRQKATTKIPKKPEAACTGTSCIPSKPATSRTLFGRTPGGVGEGRGRGSSWGGPKNGGRRSYLLGLLKVQYRIHVPNRSNS